MQYKIIDNDRRDRNDSHEFDGEQVVWIDGTGDVTNPRTDSEAVRTFLDKRPRSATPRIKTGSRH